MSTSEIKVLINKKTKKSERSELEQLSKTELIDRIVQLEAHNVQLRNILQKKIDIESGAGSTETTTEDFRAGKRKFDFSKSHKRHVLLKLLYFGWDYHGFACQEDSGATIEHHLFKALTRTCLIESRASANYHRCGRTDKGVSAYCQVISIDLRSKFGEDEQFDEANIEKEIDYCTMLNGVLPKNIQCIAWMPLRSKVYSARFDCVERTYRYFFPRGELDIESMRAACKSFIGSQDFRNFCKMDVHNGVTKFIRRVKAADIHACQKEALSESSYGMFYLEITANAFLWHQIRCIVAVLLLIGQGKEEVGLVEALLDVEKNPCKPQYSPALGLPLNLFKCDFRDKTAEIAAKQDEDDDFEDAIDTDELSTVPNEDNKDKHTTFWVYKQETLSKLIATLQGEWTEASIKTTMIREVLQSLEGISEENFKTVEVKSHVNILQESIKSKNYQKILSRKRCESLENRIDHFVKKQRLVVKDV